MNLYLKYRPTNLSEVKGNATLVATLEGMLEKVETCPHTFLLFGPTGCGKTTIARIIADRLGCVGSDYKEVDVGDLRGVDTIREIVRNSQYKAMEGPRRVWVIDECHEMTNVAQNAFLKTLEDTPPHVYFILCTTDPQKLLPTLKGRCIQLQVKPLTDQQMLGLLQRIVKKEGQLKKVPEEVYEQIIESSQGLPRNALQILEQVLSVPEEDRLEISKLTATQVTQSFDLCRALMRPNTKWKEVATILSGLQDQEAESIRRMVLGYCKSTLLKADVERAGLVMEEFIHPFYDSGFPQLVFACYSVIKS